LIRKDIWDNIYDEIELHGKSAKTKINISNMHFELLVSCHFSNNIETMLLILRDITTYQNAILTEQRKNKELENELNILQSVIDQQNNIVFVSDGYNLLSANKKLLDFYKVSSIEQFQQKYINISKTFIEHESFFHPNENSTQNWIEQIKTLPKKDRIVSIFDLDIFEPKAFNLQVDKLNSDETKYIITLTDITEIKLESQKYHFHATHDALTQIYNRSYYFEKITQAIEYATRYNAPFCVILFDVDHFKKFNDKYGHLIGDEVLRSISKTIKLHTRKSDTFARWGGEEFIILVEKSHIQKAELIAQNYRKLIANIKIENVEPITSSFGVTMYKDGDTEKVLLKRVDDALYEAKEAGRNTVVTKL
jgi:diguanylate cyclase (GGDEF)-like protein